jgi:type VI secretion system secreted protein Hcp
MSVYLYIPKINGGVTEKNHEKWIQVDSSQFGSHRHLSDPTGKATNRETGNPSVSELSFTKAMDDSSIEVWGWAIGQWDAKECKVDIVSTGRDDPFIQYKLYDAVVSSYSVSAPSEGAPMEMFTLNFTKIETKFTPIGRDNKPGTPITKVYDLATGKAG